MFSSKQNDSIDLIDSRSNDLIDPLTKWLIRISCILIILFFGSIIIEIPIAAYVVKQLLQDLAINSKETLKLFLESYL